MLFDFAVHVVEKTRTMFNSTCRSRGEFILLDFIHQRIDFTSGDFRQTIGRFHGLVERFQRSQSLFLFLKSTQWVKKSIEQISTNSYLIFFLHLVDELSKNCTTCIIIKVFGLCFAEFFHEILFFIVTIIKQGIQFLP